MEQAGAVLAVGVRAGSHVLVQQRSDLLVLQIGAGRRGDDRTAGDVVQMAHHQVVVRRSGVLARIRVELAREHRAECSGLGVHQRCLEAGTHRRRVDDHLGDLLPHMRHPAQPVRVRDQLREPDQHVGAVGHRAQAAQAFPQSERVREDGRARGLPVQHDPLVGDEYVIEDDEALREALPAGDGEVTQIGVPRCIGGVDDLHALGVDRDHRGDRVLLLTLTHGLRRDGEQLVPERCCRDVQLRTANHHTVGLPVDHADVGVRVRLLAGMLRAIPFGIGDALGDAYVALLCILHHRLDTFDVLRGSLGEPAGSGREGLQRRIGYVRHHPGPVDQLHRTA